MTIKRFHLTIIVALLIGILSPWAAAQSLVSGDVTGIVSDPTGAVLPKATVSIKNNGTGHTQNATTNAAGVYRFSLLAPGNYTVTAGASGLENISHPVVVTAGQAATLNLQLAVGLASQTVEDACGGGNCASPKRRHFHHLLKPAS